ncbi:GyrI-like domain-containing protein [Marispirochaeta sp.]|jgi:effector-binding domain-containing protein|uniref:GyrI-like domain-containing protein n=1 Tax=Marispirochaeta sp. TaxID=2038653 RepID=UPI0029C95885|nr:GyrI-like domain-containing protein [Marispirochaeta sp.]
MEIKEVDEQHTLALRYTTPVSKLSETMGKLYNEIAAYMQQEEIPFAGAPFALYHNMDMEALDVEIGFPVSSPARGKGRIQAGTLPGGKVLCTLYTGPYSGMEKPYGELMDYIQQHKLKTASFSYEYYLNDPAITPEDELQTEIYFPLKE